MDFKDFAKSQKNKNNDIKDTFDDTFKRVRGKSDNEMMQEILKQADIARKNGLLKEGDLQNFYNTVAPRLDNNQRKKLQSIIERIDE